MGAVSEDARGGTAAGEVVPGLSYSDIGVLAQIPAECVHSIRTVGNLEEQTMPQSKRGRSQDRAKVAGGQKHEVAYEAGKTGASPRQVRQAVKDAGNSRKKVEDKLANK